MENGRTDFNWKQKWLFDQSNYLPESANYEQNRIHNHLKQNVSSNRIVS